MEQHAGQVHDETSARSKRNSVQYRESQADKLLGLEGRSLSHQAVDEDMEGIGEEAWRNSAVHRSQRRNGQMQYEQAPQTYGHHHGGEMHGQHNAPSAIMS